MGADTITSGEIVVGYPYDLHVVFEGTRFDNLDRIFCEDSYEELAYDKQIDEEEINAGNYHAVLRESWNAFIAKSHPALVERKYEAIIGATEIVGEYEKMMYPSCCVIVFGNYLRAKSETDESNENFTIGSPEHKFPKNMESICSAFIQSFKEEHCVTASTAPSKPIKRARIYRYVYANSSGCSALPGGPEVVSFVV